MTDFAALIVADRAQKARVIHLVDKDNFAGWIKARPADDRALLEAHRFDGKKGFSEAESIALRLAGSIAVAPLIAPQSSGPRHWRPPRVR